MPKKTPITPYKQIGGFCGQPRPKIYSIDKLFYIALPIDNTFKVLSLPDMRVKLLGPTLESKVTAIEAYNEILYVASGKKLLKFSFLHLVPLYF